MKIRPALRTILLKSEIASKKKGSEEAAVQVRSTKSVCVCLPVPLCVCVRGEASKVLFHRLKMALILHKYSLAEGTLFNCSNFYMRWGI